MVKLRLVHGDNYRMNHPTKGWGQMRKGDTVELEDNYAAALLDEGEQVRPDLFIPRFEVVDAVVVEKVVKKAEPEVTKDEDPVIDETANKKATAKAPANKKAAPRRKKA